MPDRFFFSIDAAPGVDAGEVPATLFGFNTEITRRGCWQGLAAEMISNRKFAAIGKDGFAARWLACGAGSAATLQTSCGYAGNHCIRVNNLCAGRFSGIAQEEAALQLTAERGYRLRVVVRSFAPQSVE